MVNKDRLKLDQPISKEEITNSIIKINNDKALGLDGLTIEFYKSYIDWTRMDLTMLYELVIEEGSLGTNRNRNLIRLVPKDGDKDLINNWRLIYLFNVSYNIMAKIQALRMENILPNVLNSIQIGFMKEKYILENIITYWEAMD